jgi:MFS transporter, AAHS family, 4-hydroxybenzoate transporter
MYGIGSIVGILVTAELVKRLPLESILARVLVFGAVCVLAVGLLKPRFALLSLLLGGVGIGSGCQAGINTLSALSYPSTIRSLCAGWAMGAGKIGTIAGPLLGGLLLGFGLQPQEMFILLSIPAFGTAVLMVVLGRTFAGTRERRS